MFQKCAFVPEYKNSKTCTNVLAEISSLISMVVFCCFPLSSDSDTLAIPGTAPEFRLSLV